MKRTGAEIIISMIEREGIDTISGIPGGANLPMYDAMHTSGIRHILARHEQGAGFIAQGQARATGKTAVCFATSGPGATNLLTALADAKSDSVPMIAITGQVSRALMGTDAFQEVDMCAMAEPATKKTFFADSAESLLAIMPEAFRIANSGRPGPVLIDVPKDVQKEICEFDHWPEPVGCTYKIPGGQTQIPAVRIREAAGMINSAERPILYVGGGAMNSKKHAAVIQLAERNSIPVTTTLMGLGACDSAHPLYLGMLGMHGAASTNHAISRCDLLIACGARFDDRATGKVSEFCQDASIIHIDIDAREINKIKNVHCAINVDLGEALHTLLPYINTAKRTEWWSEIATLKKEDRCDTAMYPKRIIRSIGKTMSPDTIITTDVGQHQMWAAQSYPFSQPRTFLTSGGLGTMGFGLPAAIGAALEHPDKTVICFTGDGSLLMNIQELAVMQECGLNVKVIVFNNQSLGLVRQQQELFYNQQYAASQFSCNPDFAAIGRGFGVQSYTLDDPAIAFDQLSDILSDKGPMLVDLKIAEEMNVFPMVAPGSANTDMIFAETQQESFCVAKK